MVYRKTKKIDALSDTQVTALHNFIAITGKQWREKLVECHNACEYVQIVGNRHAPALHALLEAHRPEFLISLKTNAIKQAGRQIEAAMLTPAAAERI